MSITSSVTMDGTVYRRITAHGEDAWRLNPDGSWAHCADHNGPWVSVATTQLPAEIVDHLLEFRAVMLGTTIEQERSFWEANPHGYNLQKVQRGKDD